MYRIVFWDGDREIGSTPWPGTLETAKVHAKAYRVIHKATLAEVVDTDAKKVVAAFAEQDDAHRT